MIKEYPEKLAEKIDKLDFNNMDFAEEMIDIWNLAQKELISEFVNDLGHIFSCQSLSCVEIRCGEIRTKWEEKLR